MGMKPIAFSLQPDGRFKTFCRAVTFIDQDILS